MGEYTTEQWNTRPIEDALRAALPATLEAAWTAGAWYGTYHDFEESSADNERMREDLAALTSEGDKP